MDRAGQQRLRQFRRPDHDQPERCRAPVQRDRGQRLVLVLAALPADPGHDAKCIWYTNGGTFINCTVSECNERHTLTATVPAWYLVGSGTISGNTWEKTRHTYTGNYAIWIETTGPTAYNYGNSFRDITWEVCDGGFIKLLGQYGGSLENLISYDRLQRHDQPGRRL